MFRLFVITFLLQVIPSIVVANTYSATVSPQNYDFGNVNIGQSQTQTFTITNTGSGNLTFKGSNPTVTGASLPSAYSLTSSTCGSGLSSGSSCTLVVTFAPNAVGSTLGDLTYSFNEIAPNLYTYMYGTGIGNPLLPQDQLFISAYPPSISINGTSVLSVTGGSGSGDITYNLVGGPCSLTDSTITGIGAGNCLVTATKAGDGTYASITSNPEAITVSGPPIVLNLVATPGPGYIRLDFTNTNTASSFSNTQARTNSVITYTGTCLSTNGGVTASSTGTSSPLTVTGVTAGKTYTCTVTGTDGSGSSTSAPSNIVVPTPSTILPNAIPTLSGWVKILMMLLMIGTVGLHSRKMIK